MGLNSDKSADFSTLTISYFILEFSCKTQIALVLYT